jgi:hypothetical protein
MGYKKDLKHRVADLLMEHKPKPKQLRDDRSWLLCNRTDKHAQNMLRSQGKLCPWFYIVDSAEENHYGILMEQKEIPYFMRKAGMYGMIWSEGLCIPVGALDRIAVLQVHVVEESDLS